MRLVLAMALLPAIALGAPKCQVELGHGLRDLAATEVDERPVVAIALAGDLCKDLLSPAIQSSVKSLMYADVATRARILGKASSLEEARADFVAACPAWEASPFADDFAGGKPVEGAKVFEGCQFARFQVMTVDEFSKAEVRFATMALVLFDSLTRGGIDKKQARQVARAIVKPLEVGPPPPKHDPAKARAKLKALMKGDLKEEE